MQPDMTAGLSSPVQYYSAFGGCLRRRGHVIVYALVAVFAVSSLLSLQSFFKRFGRNAKRLLVAKKIVSDTLEV
jgi:hypothetical protein